MWPLIKVPLGAKFYQDQDRLKLALERLCGEDRSLRIYFDRDTGQLLLGGQSEEHLGRVLATLSENDRLEINIGRPQVAYHETITKLVEYTYTYRKQTNSSGQYAQVKIVFQLLARDQGFEFVEQVIGVVPITIPPPDNFPPAVGLRV